MQPRLAIRMIRGRPFFGRSWHRGLTPRRLTRSRRRLRNWPSAKTTVGQLPMVSIDISANSVDSGGEDGD